MDMVEKVARALCDDTLTRWRSPIALKPEPWREFIPAAHAAIEAMREPTETMRHSGACAHSSADTVDAVRCYLAMIDAALTPTNGGTDEAT